MDFSTLSLDGEIPYRGSSWVVGPQYVATTKASPPWVRFVPGRLRCVFLSLCRRL